MYTDTLYYCVLPPKQTTKGIANKIVFATSPPRFHNMLVVLRVLCKESRYCLRCKFKERMCGVLVHIH